MVRAGGGGGGRWGGRGGRGGWGGHRGGRHGGKYYEFANCEPLLTIYSGITGSNSAPVHNSRW